MESLGTALPKEQARVREVLGNYKAIGPSGAFGVAMIESALQYTDNAIMSGDLTLMIRAYEGLKKITD